MSYEDFIVLVGKMRDAQKLYFKTRSKDALRASIKLEGEVDYAVKDMS